MSISQETVYAPHPSPHRAVGYFMAYNDKVDRMVYYLDNVLYLRGMTNTFDVDTYNQHSGKLTCVSYSPNGRWIASGEETGTVRVWTPQNAEKILQLETRPIAGPILDISWTDDNGRISVIGHGSQGYGFVINAETGSAQGEVMGHSRPVNTGALKPNRPFRLVTAGDDYQHNFYKGPPFKFDHSTVHHDKFVLCIRYAPNGSKYASVGLDGRVCVYEGLTGELLNKFEFDAGITCIAFSPDSTQAMLSLMNGTVLVISIDDGSVKETYNIGPEIYQQQSGCIWTAKHKISVSLNGDLNFLENGEVKTIRGHSTGVTAICPIPGGFATGDSRGMVLFHKHNENPHAAWRIDGNSPAIKGLAPIGDGSQVLAACADGKLFVLDSTTGEEIKNITIEKSAIDMVYAGDVIVMYNQNEITVLKDLQPTTFSTGFEIGSIAVRPSGDEIAVGDKSGFIHFFNLEGKETGKFKSHAAAICAISYSQDGEKLAVSSANKDISVWNRNDTSESLHEGWRFHSLPVTRILFMEDGKSIITVSKDRSIRLWSLEKKRKNVLSEKAHAQMISQAILAGPNKLVTVGDDGAIRSWVIEAI